MKIVCTSNVSLGQEAFSSLGKVEVVNPPDVTRVTVRDADVLVIRSRTRVDRDLLEGSKVSFVGTATAGTDHMDLNYLEEAGVAWCASPGCNANGVVEYVVAALFSLARKRGIKLEGMTMGVIGVGHVGGRVAKAAAESLGMRVLLNDPPLKKLTGKAMYVGLRDLLRESDIVTMHVPLTRGEPFPTSYMANHRFFRDLKPGCILINTSRGEVLDSDALMFAIQRGVVTSAVLDVWDGEPMYPKELLDAVDLGTSHIAGHSYEGKVNGTYAVYQEACHFMETEPIWNPFEHFPLPPVPEIELETKGLSDEEVMGNVVQRVYDIDRDDRALRDSCVDDDAARAANFVRLHLEYPNRREFSNTRVMLVGEDNRSLECKLAGLGFRVTCS